MGEIQPILKVRNLVTSFSKGDIFHPVINEVSFDLRPSEILGIVGESGSGKTITCLSLLQLLPENKSKIDKGEVWFEDDDVSKDLTSLSQEKIRKFRGKDIAIIFQEPLSAFNPSMRLGKQMLESLLTHEIQISVNPKDHILTLLSKVQLSDPERIFEAYPHELSGGQLQRVMIAMALICNPKILIADEPTTALDVGIQKEILTLLKKIKNELGVAIIFISHELPLVKGFCDNVIIMQKGNIVEKGSVDLVFNNPKHPYTKGLIACSPPLDIKLKQLPTVEYFLDNPDNTSKKFYSDHLISIDESKLRLKQIASSPTIVECKKVSKKFVQKTNWFGKATGFIKAVNDVDLKIRKGEIVGLVGESGSGKTTLSNLINGVLSPDNGDIYFKGKSILEYSNREWRKYHKSLQYIYQNPYSSLNPKMSIGEAIKEPLIVHDLFKSSSDKKARVMTLLEEVGLASDFYNRYPRELSGGQRQRVVIARALAVEPEVLICDECVSALDVSVQSKIVNLLLDLRQKHNLSFLFISHDLAVVRFISDKVVVMKDGGVVENIDAINFIEKAENPYTKQLISSISTNF